MSVKRSIDAIVEHLRFGQILPRELRARSTVETKLPSGDLEDACTELINILADEFVSVEQLSGKLRRTDTPEWLESQFYPSKECHDRWELLGFAERVESKYGLALESFHFDYTVDQLAAEIVAKATFNVP